MTALGRQCKSASYPRTLVKTGGHNSRATASGGRAAVNRNGSFARNVIDTGHNVDNANGVSLKACACFPIAGERLRRGERGVLRPGWLNGKPHQNPIHWLTLRITDTHNQFGSLGKCRASRTKPDQRVGDM